LPGIKLLTAANIGREIVAEDSSMENLAGISEHQVLPNEQREQYIHFFICLLSFFEEKLLSSH